MIRFCDKEVYSLKITDAKRGKLFQHFCSSGHALDIIMMYDEQENYIGYLTYDTLLKNDTKEISNLLELSYVVKGDNLIADARKFFEEFPEKIWLLICNNRRQPLCFAYQDKARPSYKLIDQYFNLLESDKNIFGIRDLFPEIEEIIIYDFNEWAYRLEKICIENQINVTRVGDKWNLIYDTIPFSVNQVPDYLRINVYAEGTELCKCMKEKYGYKFNDISQSFFFLKNIAIESCLKLITETKEKSCLNKNTYICRIPSFQELKNPSEKELFRNYNLLQATEEQFEKEFIAIAGMSKEELNKKGEEERQIYGKFNLIGDVQMREYSEAGKFTVYLIGPCIVEGNLSLFKDSLPFQLQQYLNTYGDWNVKAIVVAEGDYVYLDKIMNQIPVASKDMIIFMYRKEKKMEIKVDPIPVDLDLLDLMNGRPEDMPWFYDTPIHTTKYGNKAVAEEVFQKLAEPHILSRLKDENDFLIQQGQYLSEEGRVKLKKYLESIRLQTAHISEDAEIGAIVMNCNPFTLGHLYLIEESAKKVDHLFIFVVEEDKSEFDFKDRFNLVKIGTRHLKQVHIFPSGEFILSLKTFPSYFKKDELQEAHVDASIDVNIFARYIAKELHIKVRFVGEEPLDNVTNQYNRDMEMILQKYGIQFKEILRKKQENMPISASKVRALLSEGNLEKVKNLVPLSTFEYLQGRVGGDV